MSEGIFPIRKPSVVTREMESECILYDPDAKVVHIVNVTARDVWKLCDGKHSLEEIAMKLYEEYDIEMSVLEKDTQKIISDLEKIGLLSCSSEPKGQSSYSASQ
jgi:hypothetical protein